MKQAEFRERERERETLQSTTMTRQVLRTFEASTLKASKGQQERAKDGEKHMNG
jgi:hypothetical protein